jgi:hypothetical protein
MKWADQWGRKLWGKITPLSITAAGGEILGAAPNRVGLIFSAADGGAYSISTDGNAAFGVGFTIEPTSGIIDLYDVFTGDLPGKQFFAISKSGTVLAGVVEVYLADQS